MTYSNAFLLTVHGLNSTNDGLKRLRQRCEQEMPGLLVDSFYYGQVMPFKQLSQSAAEIIFRTLRDHIAVINKKHLIPYNRKFFIVAHSFGTLAIVRALEMSKRDLSIAGLILLGSVVPRHQDWNDLVDSACLSVPPLAIIRPFDAVTRVAHFIGGGPSGTDGFIPTGVHQPREVHKNGGHTAYDPADESEIISMIKHGVMTVPLKDLTTWRGEQSWFKLFGLACKKMIL